MYETIKNHTMLHFPEATLAKLIEILQSEPYNEYYKVEKNDMHYEVYIKNDWLFSVHPNYVVYQFGRKFSVDCILFKCLSMLIDGKFD